MSFAQSWRNASLGKYGPESMFASLSAAAKRFKWKESEENDGLEYNSQIGCSCPSPTALSNCKMQFNGCVPHMKLKRNQFGIETQYEEDLVDFMLQQMSSVQTNII